MGFCIPGMWVLWAASSDSNTDKFITRYRALMYKQLNTFFPTPFVPQLSLSICWLDGKWVLICSHFYIGYQVSPAFLTRNCKLDSLDNYLQGSPLSGLKAPCTPGASPISVLHPFSTPAPQPCPVLCLCSTLPCTLFMCWLRTEKKLIKIAL